MLVAAQAGAQVHVDVGAEVGAMKRFSSDRPPGGPDAGFGPVLEVHGHVAILPFVRAGVYFTHDIAPVPGITAREITTGGFRLKVAPPLRSGRFRTWAFVGFGYAGVYAPGYQATLPLGAAGAPAATTVSASGGSYFEVPLGIGVGYKLRRREYFGGRSPGGGELTCELGSRFGFGFQGSLYGEDGGRAAFVSGSPQEQRVPKQGNDVFALALSLGYSFDL